MGKHVVMWRIQPEDKAAKIAKLKGMLLGLKSTVPSIRNLEVGVNWNEEPTAWDVVLVSDFEDRAGLDAYQKHPEHVKVAEYLKAVRTDRAVADYDL